MPHRRRSLFLLPFALAALGASAASPATAQVAGTTPVTSPPVDRTPGIQAVSPNQGPAAGGNTVNVSTRSLSGGDVRFGGKPAQVKATAVGDDFVNGIAYYYYTVVVPPGTAGTTVDVTVGGRGGLTATSDDYTYAGPPSPTQVQCSDGFSVYYPLVNVAAPTVTIANVAVPSKQVGQVLEFSRPSPDYARGPSYSVAVDGALVGVYRGGCFSPSPSFFGQPTDPVGINKVITGSGPTAGGNQVVAVVDGDVAPTAVLYFGDTPGLETRVSPNRFTCLPEAPTCPTGQRGWLVSATAPSGSAGWVDVSVRSGSTVFRGQAATLDDYEYVAPTSIASVSPARGALAGGNFVTVQLSGDYVREPAVTVGGVASPSVETSTITDLQGGLYGEQQLRVAIPAGKTAGATTLEVTGISTLGDTKTISAQAGYTYDAPVAVNTPTVSSVVGNGVTGLGGLILLRGTNLSGLKSVRVGSRTVTPLSKSSTLIFGFVPTLAKGSYPVTVTTRTGSTTAAARYTFK